MSKEMNNNILMNPTFHECLLWIVLEQTKTIAQSKICLLKIELDSQRLNVLIRFQ